MKWIRPFHELIKTEGLMESCTLAFAFPLRFTLLQDEPASDTLPYDNGKESQKDPISSNTEQGIWLKKTRLSLKLLCLSICFTLEPYPPPSVCFLLQFYLYPYSLSYTSLKKWSRKICRNLGWRWQNCRCCGLFLPDATNLHVAAAICTVLDNNIWKGFAANGKLIQEGNTRILWVQTACVKFKMSNCHILACLLLLKKTQESNQDEDKSTFSSA